jgi:hypothetical protein
MAKNAKPKKPPKPSGVDSIDALATNESVTLQDYLDAVSEYVRRSPDLDAKQKKAGQIRLSNALGKALYLELRERLPNMTNATYGERVVSGALRTVNADVSELHELDGLRLAIELKPVNLAVGRAIWNRFGDIRTFAVNLHLRFPFAVVGGVLVIPTYELKKSSKDEEEADTEELEELELDVAEEEGDVAATAGTRKDTTALIRRAVNRLVRAGGRERDSDAPHLLEAISVVVYDPDTGQLHPDLPPPGCRLRWDEFVDDLVKSYEARFED